MSKSKQAFKLTAISSALMWAFAAAHADDNVKQFTSPDSSVSLGVGHWTNDRHQMGTYDGMRDDGVYGLFDLNLIKRDDATGTWYTLNGSNLGLDTRELSAEWLKQGDIGAKLEYSRTPRDNPWTIQTTLQGAGKEIMVQGGSGANALPMHKEDLETHRDLWSLGFYKNLMPGLDFKLSFKNEEKDGTRHWGRGSTPTFAVEPINSTTRQLEAVLEYANETWQLSGGYYASWYDNHNSLAFVSQKGFIATNTTGDPANTPLTLPLDNQSHQFFVNGGYNFTPTTRATFKASYSKATQDETLPTWGLPAPSNRFVGAPSKLDGEVETTIFELGLTSRPIKDLSLVANLRYHDMDDQTPLAGYVGNNGTGAITVHNTPHSIKTTSGKIEGTYRLPYQMSLTGGYDTKRQDRSHPLFEAERYVPFRDDLDEDTWRVQLRRSMSDTVNGSIGYYHTKRDGSHYLPTEHFPSDLINPIHIADRERDKWRLSVDWVPIENLTLQGVIEDSQDNYDTSANRPYGLQNGSAKLYSLDATYVIEENWSVSAWYAHDETEAKQTGARWNRISERYELDKESRLEDKGDAVGFSLSGRLTPALKIGANLQWIRNNSDYRDYETRTGIGAGLTPPTVGARTTTRDGIAPTDIENKVDRFMLFAEYTLHKQGDIRFDFIHERWHTNDWSWNFANGTPFVYGAGVGNTVDGTTVTAKDKQTSNFMGIRYIYKFQ